MAEEKYLSIEKEIEARGIEKQYFNTLYNKIKETQQLPPSDVVSEAQYTSIVNYLRDKKVLDNDNKIQADELKVFDARMNLEEMLRNEILEPHNPDDMEPSGGVVSCRYEDEFKSSGGTVACRY